MSEEPRDDPKPPTSARVLEDAWRRERRAVAAVILAHMPREADLEDLLQEVALILVDRGAEVRDPAKLGAWLRTVAMNVARTAGRRTHRASATSDAADPARLADPRPDRDREHAEARAAVDKVLGLTSALPDHLQETLLLRCVEGLSQKEIARRMDVPVTTVESRLARARRRLRESFDKRTTRTDDDATADPRQPQPKPEPREEAR